MFKTGNTKFEAIAEKLRRRILDGDIPPNARIPSVREFAREEGVALVTAQRALAKLATEGYLIQKRGAGSFVAPVEKKRSEEGARLVFRYILVGRKATDPTYSVIFHQLVRATSEVGGDLVCSEVLTAGGHDHTSAAIRELLVNSPEVHGLIVNGDTTEDQILEIQRLGIPFVLGDPPSPRLAHSCDVVTFDHHAAAELLVEHLVGLGHRRIGVLAGGVAVGWPVYIHAMATQEFREGYCVALTRHGIAVDRQLIYGARNLIDPEEGALGTRRLLSLGPAPTAIIALSNRLAVGALGCLKEEGLAVPDDVSLASAADFAPARDAKPPITVVGEDHAELARETIRLLVERTRRTRTEPVDVRPPLKLIVRASTGPCVSTCLETTAAPGVAQGAS